MLLHDFRKAHADVTVQLLEDKTIRLLPRLLSGAVDLAFVRPPGPRDKRIEFLHLFHESAVVAVPARHPLAGRKRLSIQSLADEPLIVPDRRSRPHSHDLTIKLFARAGLRPIIAQVAEEKQTIVNLVAANIGLAIVPRWASRMAVPGVRYVPLVVKEAIASRSCRSPPRGCAARAIRRARRCSTSSRHGWRGMRPRREADGGRASRARRRVAAARPCVGPSFETRA